jgi:hypothetical protein
MHAFENVVTPAPVAKFFTKLRRCCNRLQHDIDGILR